MDRRRCFRCDRIARRTCVHCKNDFCMEHRNASTPKDGLFRLMSNEGEEKESHACPAYYRSVSKEYDVAERLKRIA